MSAPQRVYLTRADWLTVASAFERRCPARYVRQGEVEGEVQIWRTAQEAADFGVAPTGDESTNPQFLILPADAEPVARTAVLYVIVGEVALPAADGWAEAAHQALLEGLAASTQQVGGFLVGPEALERMRRGARLTPYIDGDTLYDLRES